MTRTMGEMLDAIEFGWPAREAWQVGLAWISAYDLKAGAFYPESRAAREQWARRTP